MLATLGEHRWTIPLSSTSRSTTGSAPIEIRPRQARRAISIWSRLGNEKTSQFPERSLRALERVRRGLRGTLVLDGEIVALDARGQPAGFQQLQGRIHLSSVRAGTPQGVAFIAFDLLCDGEATDGLPLLERRARLEAAREAHGAVCVRAERSWRAAMDARCSNAPSDRAGKASSASAPTRATGRASARPTGAS